MDFIKVPARNALWRLAPAVYRELQVPLAQEFSIAIVTADSPLALRAAASTASAALTWQHVTDVPAAFVADPFLCRDRGRWYLYFEVMNLLTRRGEIAVAVSDDDAATWEYQRIILAEPWHLSYPYVFDWEGTHYMIPESGQKRAVCLYRAAPFPDRWQCVANLLEGDRYADSSIFRYQDSWWLFTYTGVDPAQPVLRLFCADELFGPWREHPASPIRTCDPRYARPAGRVIDVGGTLIRFAQDSYPVYGRRVFAHAITTLTRSEYADELVGDGPVLDAGTQPWNQDGMHHIDAHLRADGSWIACVDGFRRREPGKP